MAITRLTTSANRGRADDCDLKINKLKIIFSYFVLYFFEYTVTCGLVDVSGPIKIPSQPFASLRNFSTPGISTEIKTAAIGETIAVLIFVHNVTPIPKRSALNACVRLLNRKKNQLNQ